MEKLLELLNEYHHFNSDLIGYFYDEEYEKFYFKTELPEKEKKKLKKAGIELEDDGIDETWIENEWICSKRFGFIKWLVEENKIDYEKVRKWENSDSKWDFGTCQPEYFMIMLLSIQENPIKFLLSILK